MAMTPEGVVKAKVKKILAEFGDKVDGFWPVPSGYGESHLDWVGCVNGYFVSLEIKKPGGKATPRQLERIRTVQLAGGYAAVIDGTEKTTTYEELRTRLMLLAAGYDL